MPKHDESVPPLVIATNAAEGIAQTTLSFLTGALQAVATDLRAVHESLSAPGSREGPADDPHPGSLTAHLRSAIECVLADFLEPAIRTLGRAAITTATEAYEEWEKEEAWRPAEP
jgi:hypothetical protein